MAFVLNIGPVKLAWHIDGRDRRWKAFIAAYRPYFGGGRGHVDLHAEIQPARDGEPHPVWPNSFIRARRIEGRSFVLGDDLVRGRTDGPDRIDCLIHPSLLSGNGLRVLEQFFYLLFYHVTLRSPERGLRSSFLLHSSGVLDGERAYVFCGPAGSGKSTAVELCPVRDKLSDEALVLAPAGKDWSVLGSPINPFYRKTATSGGRLTRLCLLEHAGEHDLQPISRREAVPRLTAEVIAPLGLLEENLAAAIPRALEHSLRLYASADVRRLGFRPDPGFWQLVTQSEKRAGANLRGERLS